MSTTTLPAPALVTHGSTDSTAPLVVLLHGRGSDEHALDALAGTLPQGPQYVALRAPVAEPDGYAWCEHRGVGRPVAESLAATMRWFGAWLDSVAPADRPVVLVGFSGGALVAGGLALTDPHRFAGVAILYGTLPFYADLPIEPDQLDGLPVFLAHGESDAVVPHDLLDATWAYLTRQSGASTRAHLSSGGHGLTVSALSGLGDWLTDTLAL